MSCDIFEEHEALLQFLYLAPIGLVQADLDGGIVLVNPLCSQLLMPLSRDGGLGNLFTVLEPVAPDLRFLVQSFEHAQGMICDAMQLHVTDGRTARGQPQVLSLSLLKLDGERLMAVIGDITQSVRQERELRQSQAWIHTIVTGLTDFAVVSLDDGGHIRSFDDGISRVTGFDRGAVLGRPCSMFYPGDANDTGRMRDRLREADQSGWSLDEGWRLQADGTRYWGSCLIAPLQHPAATPPGQRGYSLIIRDLSDHREAREALRRSIACDHLTGLANRRALFEAAARELDRWACSQQPLSVVLVDADHFKRINDRHGHAAGDAVLRHLAAGLSATFARAGDVVARLGGEEFVALLPGVPVEQAAALALRLCRSIAARPVEVGGVQIHCSISAGVAAMEPGLDGFDALVQRADAAMYAAKANGRCRVECWRPGLRRREHTLAATL